MRATVESVGVVGARGARGRGPGGPARGSARLLLQGDPEGRSHLRLQQRRGGGPIREVGRDGPRHHEAGRRPERRDGRRRQRAGAAALLSSSTASRKPFRSRRRRSSASSGATARRGSRPTSPTSRSPTACRRDTRTSSRTTSRRFCPERALRAIRRARSASAGRSSSSRGGSGFHPKWLRLPPERSLPASCRSCPMRCS